MLVFRGLVTEMITYHKWQRDHSISNSSLSSFGWWASILNHTSNFSIWQPKYRNKYTLYMLKLKKMKIFFFFKEEDMKPRHLDSDILLTKLKSSWILNLQFYLWFWKLLFLLLWVKNSLLRKHSLAMWASPAPNWWCICSLWGKSSVLDKIKTSQ
jgi:hypothetical protein